MPVLFVQVAVCEQRRLERDWGRSPNLRLVELSRRDEWVAGILHLLLGFREVPLWVVDVVGLTLRHDEGGSGIGDRREGNQML